MSCAAPLLALRGHDNFLQFDPTVLGFINKHICTVEVREESPTERLEGLLKTVSVQSWILSRGL